jgi:nitrogen fixation protein NifX
MLRTAYATGDGTAVDQHFGWCRRFDIYDLSAAAVELVEVRYLPDVPDDELDKINSRLDQVRDCAIIHICDIGGSAAAKVVNARIHPVKVPSGTPVEELVSRLQKVIAGTPPPWLRKVLAAHRDESAPAWTPIA